MTSIRVLIVEDLPEYGELLSRFLTEAGCETNVVASVEEALSYAGKEPEVSIVTLDLNLGPGGPDRTISQIHEVATAMPDSVIIIISGAVSATDTQRLLEAGAHGFIHKMEIPTLGKFGGRISNILGMLTSSPPRMMHNVARVEQLAKHFAEWTRTRFGSEAQPQRPQPK